MREPPLAINPPSDIILDVAKAADPLQYSAAVERLAQIGGAPEVADGFDLLLNKLEPSENAPAPKADAFDWTRADLRSRLDPFTQREMQDGPQPAQVQFEAFVLQTFIQSMFPKDAEHVFGGGIAGSTWSSMLAEQVAGQVAKAGGIGIADELAALHTPSRQSYGLSAILSDQAAGTTPSIDFDDSEG